MGSFCSMRTLWLGHKEMDGVFFFNKTTNLLNRLENGLPGSQYKCVTNIFKIRSTRSLVTQLSNSHFFHHPMSPFQRPLIVFSPSLWNLGFYEDPSSTGGPDSPPSTFCGDSGFSGSGSYGRLGPSEPRGIYASERPKSLGKVGGVGLPRARLLTTSIWVRPTWIWSLAVTVPFCVILSTFLLSGLISPSIKMGFSTSTSQGSFDYSVSLCPKTLKLGTW